MYIPLYNKTTYSFLSSLLSVDDLIKIAIDNNLKSISITDNNLFGAMEFIKKCQDNNINPLVGLDLEDRILYAKNYQGYQNLLKLVTLKSERELTNNDFLEYKDNLICLPLKEIDLIYDTIFYPNDNTKENGNSDFCFNSMSVDVLKNMIKSLGIILLLLPEVIYVI